MHINVDHFEYPAMSGAIVIINSHGVFRETKTIILGDESDR